MVLVAAATLRWLDMSPNARRAFVVVRPAGVGVLLTWEGSIAVLPRVVRGATSRWELLSLMMLLV